MARSAKQKAATRKLVAWNKSHRKNPSGRKGKTSHSRKKGHRSNPSSPKKHHRRPRRNPSMIGNVTMMLAPIAGGATALAVDAILSKLTESRPDLQEKMQTGFGRPLIQAASAVAVGFLLAMLKQRRAGMAVTAGGLAVAGYSAAKLLALRMAPTLQLGDGDYPALSFWNSSPVLQAQSDSVSEFIPSGGPMGEFIGRGEMSGLDTEVSGADDMY